MNFFPQWRELALQILINLLHFYAINDSALKMKLYLKENYFCIFKRTYYELVKHMQTL